MLWSTGIDLSFLPSLTVGMSRPGLAFLVAKSPLGTVHQKVCTCKAPDSHKYHAMFGLMLPSQAAAETSILLLACKI